MADALRLRFADEATVNRIAHLYAEPDWMRADRHAALKLFHELPLEANPLFTLYVDLRQAKLDEIEPYIETGAAAEVSDIVPEGATALIEIADDRVVARSLSPAAAKAGVVVDTLTHGLAEHPQLASGVRAMIEGGASLPGNDKIAQAARALAPLGVLVHVPRDVVLDGPIVLRWGAGTPGRGLISRTLVDVGENAQVQLLEEQVATDAHATADDGQSLWWGTSEVRVGQGANLSFAAQQDFGPNTLAFVNRHATLERDAHLRWALASVGA